MIPDLCYGIVAVTCVFTSLWCGVVCLRLHARLDEWLEEDRHSDQITEQTRDFLVELATPGSDLSAGHVRVAAMAILRDQQQRERESAELGIEDDNA